MNNKLKLWQEIVGNVEKVENNVIYFSNRETIEIEDKSFIRNLRKYVGKRVAIIHTDIEGNKYILREE